MGAVAAGENSLDFIFEFQDTQICVEETRETGALSVCFFWAGRRRAQGWERGVSRALMGSRCSRHPDDDS